jgi:hypothetical protein
MILLADKGLRYGTVFVCTFPDVLKEEVLCPVASRLK